MNYGKSVELYLANGSAEGLVIAELANWNGKAIKINRADVAACEREDFQGAGVYFLFCEGEDGAEGLVITTHSCEIVHNTSHEGSCNRRRF